MRLEFIIIFNWVCFVNYYWGVFICLIDEKFEFSNEFCWIVVDIVVEFDYLLIDVWKRSCNVFKWVNI